MDAHSITHLIYESATDLDGWKTLPNEIAKYLKVKTVFVGVANPSDLGSAVSWTHDFSNEVWSGGPYSIADQYNPATNPMLLPILGSQVLTTLQRKNHIPDDIYSSNSFYKQAMIQQDLFYTCFSKLNHNSDFLSVAWFSPGSKHNLITQSQLDKFQILLPHLSRALTIHQKFCRLDVEAHQHRNVTDRLVQAVFVVDRSSNIFYANEAAEILFRASDGLAVRQQKLFIQCPLTRQSMTAAIKRISETMGEDSLFRDETLFIDRPSGRTPYMMLLSPVNTKSHLWSNSTRVTITITNPIDEFTLPSESQLQQQFDVTPAEARAMRLVPLGLSKPEIARRLGIAEATVKSQLDSVRQKLGAENLTTLAQLIILHRPPYR